MTATVEHHFDFGSPNCYLVHKVIPEVAARTGAAFEYVPILLGGVFKATGNQPPMLAFKDVPAKLDYMRVEVARYIRKHGIGRFKMNPHFPVNTITIMRGAVAARREPDVFAPYVDAVFKAMWEDGEKMDEPEVVQRVLDGAGLDGAGILKRTQDQEVKDALVRSTEASVARGTFGAPTFFIGEEIFFGKEGLRDVEDALGGA